MLFVSLLTPSLPLLLFSLIPIPLPDRQLLRRYRPELRGYGIRRTRRTTLARDAHTRGTFFLGFSDTAVHRQQLQQLDLGV